MSQLLNKVKGLVPSVKQVIRFAENHVHALEKYEKTHESGKKTFEDYKKWLEYPEIKQAQDNLINYLESLSYDDVIIIESIMYIGRDEKDPNDYDYIRYEEDEEFTYDPEDGMYDSPQKKVFDYLKYLKQVSKTKEIAIDTMIEKHPLPQYLERGLKVLGLI